MTYEEFLKQKIVSVMPTGFEPSKLPSNLYDYQKDLVTWACKRGKAALFTMTGTGKTAMQVSWANAVVKYTSGSVLIVAPLAVAKQTVHEAKKFGIDVNYCRHGNEKKHGVNITNYEMLHHFEDVSWQGIVLDESSILKNVTGKTRNYVIDTFKNTPFKLGCTATPSPNDYTEIGNHAEFLGICSQREMLSTFFVNDVRCPEGWRLKGHAEDKFFEWLASWGVFLTKPSDLRYSDEGFIPPKLKTHHHVVESEASEGCLFAFEAKGLQERQAARRESIKRRCEKAAEIVEKSNKPFMLWCDLNSESELLKKMIPGSVEVKGSDTPEHKEWAAWEFSKGNIPVLISKPSIFGMGLNFQSCADTAFVGLSDSFEAVFQATKRFHRHGQTREVNRHFITSEAEGSVLANINRKESEFMSMINNMVQHTAKITQENIKKTHSEKIEYKAEKQIIIPEWLKGDTSDY